MTHHGITTCQKEAILALNDALAVVSGKWKLAVVCVLMYNTKRFSEIQRMIPKITPRMLSKELKELELNGVVQRSVITSTPVVVEYTLTDSGKKLSDVIDHMVDWGMQHREAYMAEHV